jgi:hypothetical protein
VCAWCSQQCPRPLIEIRTRHIRLIGKLALSASRKPKVTDFPLSRKRSRLWGTISGLNGLGNHQLTSDRKWVDDVIFVIREGSIFRAGLAVEVFAQLLGTE